MFTGIVEDIGKIQDCRFAPEGRRLKIATALPADSIRLGDSVAVCGACLTVMALEAGAFWADVSSESLRASTLGELRSGDLVHLERALSLGGRLGGHLVTGHVDGVGVLSGRKRVGLGLELEFLAPESLKPYLIPKGSVAVDGVSLTVNRPLGERFSVALVPHTLQQTRLDQLREGARVNLEADVLGKYVRHFVSARGDSGGIDEGFLREHGFL